MMSFESPDAEGRLEPFPRFYHVIHTLTTGNDESTLQGSQEDSQVRRRDANRRKEGTRRDRKDKGYVMFEQEDSDDELVRGNEKSPRKGKKHPKPSFKFAKKDKPNKAKEKEKEKDKDKDKDEKKEKKEKDKADKEKEKQEKKEKVEKEQKKAEEEIKPKWRKRILSNVKQAEQDPALSVSEDSEAKPIFGVSLALAIERSPCHDGIQLPVVIRQCIDYIEEFGLSCEGIYRMSGVKSKVQSLKDAYNKGVEVYLQEHEPNVVASLLKQFLRQLPEPLLTAKLMPKFEQASTLKNAKQKGEQFQLLLEELPPCNRLLLSWVIVHMTHVIAKEKENKMSLQNVSIVLSPTLQISHRVLNVLFTYGTKLLFKDTVIKRYVPPLKPVTSRWTLELPDSPLAIEDELRKQESLLNHLHEELMKVKDMEKEEQLWEVQRVVTQLKRRLKHAKQTQEIIEQSEKKQKEIEQEKHNRSHPPPPPQSVQVSAIKVDETSHDKDETVCSEDGAAAKEVSAELKTTQKKPELVTGGETSQKKPEVVTDVGPAEVSKSDEVEEVQDKKEDKETVAEDAKVEPSDVASNMEELKLKDKEGPAIVEETNTEAENYKKEAEEKTVAVEKEPVKDDQNENIPQAIEGKTEIDEKVMKRAAEEELERVDDGAGDTQLQDTINTGQDKGKPLEKEKDGEHVAEEGDKEVAVVEPAAESESHVVRNSTETDDSSDAYTDVLMEDEEEGNDEMMDDTKKHALLNIDYVQLSADSPMELVNKDALPRHDIGEDQESKRQNEELGEEDQDVFSDTTTSSEPSDFEDNEEYQQLEQEHSYLVLEEEELLAIGNELRQKIASERNEIERLQQDIAELKQMRQDMFETSASSSSLTSSDSFSDSDEDLDDDDLRDLLKQLIKENKELELENADLCDKIHQERQICINVKVQNRMIQQRLLESSGYGFDLLADQESLL